jgi:hypothetical protein
MDAPASNLIKIPSVVSEMKQMDQWNSSLCKGCICTTGSKTMSVLFFWVVTLWRFTGSSLEDRDSTFL